MAIVALTNIQSRLPNDPKDSLQGTLRSQYGSGLALVLATTMEECRGDIPLYLVSAETGKGSYTGARRCDANPPTFCPDCNEPTMEVVEHKPNKIIRSPMYGLVAAEPSARFRLNS